MEEIRSMAGPITQRYFDKVEADRQAVQAKLDAEVAAKKAAEEEARKAAAAEKEQGKADKDEEMTDAEAKPDAEEAKS